MNLLGTSEQVDERGDRLEVRGWHADELGQFDWCVEQDVRFQGLACRKVHEHRRLVVADSRGALEAALDRNLRRAAEARGDLCRLVHHAKDQLAYTESRHHLAHQRPREDAYLVERYISQKLRPNVST